MTTKNSNKVSFKEKVQQARKESQVLFEEFKQNTKNPIKRKVFGQKVSNKLISIFRGFIFLGLSFIIVLPVFSSFIKVITNPTDLNNPLVKWIPEHYSLVNVEIAMELLDYWRALANNFKISILTALFQVASTSLAGYAFARLRFKGSNAIFWMVMITLIVPPSAIALSRQLYYTHFDIFGIFKAITGSSLSLKGEGKDIILYIMAILGQGLRAPLFVYLFRQFFRGIPIELEESAQIDGAGVVRTFFSVMLPNARGCITTVSLFAFVWQWNDSYNIRYFGISGKSFPLLMMNIANVSEWVAGLLKSPQFKHLRYLVGEEVNDNPLFTSTVKYAAVFITILPLLIGYLFVQRLFIEGVERSGIVG